MKAERMRDRAVEIPVIDIDTLARNWWVLLLRGIAGIIFGVLTFFWPEISLSALVLLFGAFAFADGVFALINGIRERRTNDRWWLLILQGLMGIGAGVVTLIWPGISALALLYVIAAWALVTGALEIAAAIRLRKVIEGEWLLALVRHCLGPARYTLVPVPRTRSSSGGSVDRRVCIGLRRAVDRACLSSAFLGTGSGKVSSGTRALASLSPA